MVTKSAVIGIDLGSSESYVAFVGKGIVDVVQNEVSKRATPTLVGFTERERLLGDSALAQIKSNAKNTCRNFKHLLGRQADAPDLQKEHFWSTSKLTTAEDGFGGYAVSYKGEPRDISASVVCAMFLTKLREITEKWCQAKVADVVLSVPAYFSDVQRQALMDSAKIAGLSVLRLLNEHTATALAYGIYRSNDFDPEKPMTVAFCSMGHSIFSVSIVQFVRGKLHVLCEKSDLIGGRDMDECLMREFAAQFKKKHGCDPLSNKKAVLKLEDAVTKTKKILSANSEAGCSVECLMEDEDFSSTITRSDLEKMCEPAIAKAKEVLQAVIAASGVSVEQIDSVELVGGATRVPWVKHVCSEAFGGKDLSTTMNQEESVARGCALQAAILSPLYKVREFKVEDSSQFAVNVGWQGSSADATASKDDDGDAQMAGGEGEFKTATVFPVGSAMNVLKLLTFYRTGPFDVKAEFADEKKLPPGTPKELGTFRIELPPQPEAKKVKVKSRLTLHGTFNIETAQMLEEEEYEEVVKEKRELPPDPEESPKEPAEGEGEAEKKQESAEAEGEAEKKQENGTAPMEETGEKPADEEKAEKDGDGDAKMADAEEAGGDKENKESNGPEEGDAEAEKKEPQAKAPEKRAPEPRYEWVDVVKKKRRTKRTDVNITASGRPGLDEDTLQKLQDQEFAMQAEMREIIETDERKNDLESYIFTTRDKISEGSDWGPYISDADRTSFSSALTAAEDWLYDTPDATKAQFVEKLEEIKSTGDPIVWRYKEAGMRADWIAAVAGTVKNYRAAAENPGDKYGHIAPEKLSKIAAACADLDKWLSDMKARQESVPKHEKPVLICADMERKNQELAKMADEILKEPKPPPPKPEKKEEPPKATESKEDLEEPREDKEEEAADPPEEASKEKEDAPNPPEDEATAANMDVD